jgi:hypothetical protein
MRRCVGGFSGGFSGVFRVLAAADGDREACAQAVQASEELRENLEQENREVTQLISAFHASDVRCSLHLPALHLPSLPL